MKTLNVSLFKPSNIVRKLQPKKQVEIPMELNDETYNKLAQHQKAFDYLANRYRMDFGFAENGENKARVYCVKRNCKANTDVWSQTEINSNEDFVDSAKKIYKLADEVLELYNG